VVVEPDEPRARVGLGHEDRRRAVPAADVGHRGAVPQHRVEAVDRWDPRRHQVGRVPRSEEALGPVEQVVVALVPADAGAGAEGGPHGVLVAADRRRDGHAPARRSRATVAQRGRRLLDPRRQLVDVERVDVEAEAGVAAHHALGAEHLAQAGGQHADLVAGVGGQVIPPQHVGERRCRHRVTGERQHLDHRARLAAAERGVGEPLDVEATEQAHTKRPGRPWSPNRR
jgi:hypothetical protein